MQPSRMMTTTDLSCAKCGGAIPGPTECWELAGLFYHIDHIPEASDGPKLVDMTLEEGFDVSDKAG